MSRFGRDWTRYTDEGLQRWIDRHSSSGHREMVCACRERLERSRRKPSIFDWIDLTISFLFIASMVMVFLAEIVRAATL